MLSYLLSLPSDAMSSCLVSQLRPHLSTAGQLSLCIVKEAQVKHSCREPGPVSINSSCNGAATDKLQ